MKNYKIITFLSAFMLIVLAQVAMAQTAETKLVSSKTDDWVLLESHVVDYTLDRDVIKLDDSTRVFTGLKFNVKNGPINLHKCTVDFSDGGKQEVSFETNVTGKNLIDLYGNKRGIDKITFWYDTKNSSDKKAVVEVWGKK